MNSLTVKDIACVLLHTKPFQVGDELRQWKFMKDSFIDVIRDRFIDNKQVVEEFNKIVEDK